MKYILRNLVRMPKSTILLFLMAFLIVFLSSFGLFVNTLCKETEARSFGPLYGYYSVTDNDGEPFLGYSQIADMKSHSDVITDVAAVRRLCCIVKDVAFYGTGRYITTEKFVKPEGLVEEEGEFVRGFSLVGATSTDICEEFYNGSTVMVKGQGITNSDNENGLFKAVISGKVAEMNGLSLGDSFDVNIWSLIAGYEFSEKIAAGTYSFYEGEYADIVWLPFTVGGIYHTYEDNTITCVSPEEDVQNRIYIPITTMDAVMSLYHRSKVNEGVYRGLELNMKGSSGFVPEEATGVLNNAYIALASGTDSAMLEKAMNEIGFYTDVKLTEFRSDSAELPSSRLFRIVSGALIAVMVSGFVMLMVILIYGLNARKREFNCLVSLGKSRTNVALSYFGETAIVIAVAFIVATAVFSLLVVRLGGSISAYLNAADSTVSYNNETAATFLTENTIVALREEKMLDAANLRDTYILPSALTTATVSLAVLALVLIVIVIAMKKINALRSIGEGKL